MPGVPVHSKQCTPKVTSSDSKSGDRSFRIPFRGQDPRLRGYDSRRARSYMREACLVPCAGDDSAWDEDRVGPVTQWPLQIATM